MRILLLTSYFPPEIGSASHLFHDVGEALAARGHSVDVVTGMPAYHAKSADSSYRRRLIVRERAGAMQVTRVWVPQVGRDTPIGRGIWQVASAAAIAIAAARLARPDVVLVYSPPLTLGLTAVFLRRLRGSPYVLNVQDLFPQSAIDLGVLREPMLIRAARWIERLVYRRAGALSFHSKGNLGHAVGEGAARERCYVVHNCVDTAELAPDPNAAAQKTEMGLADRFVLSFAGVMGHSQDIDVILDAAEALEEEREIAFLLVGDGVEKDRLVAKADTMDLPNVVWMPMQPRERYARILQASDVCLTTLEAEVKTPVVPSKIISAMAAGKPVIAALDPDGDAPALINEVGCGIAVPPEDPKALVGAIRRMRDDPGLREKMGAEGRRFAESHCSPASVAEQYEQIFEKIVEEGHV